MRTAVQQGEGCGKRVTWANATRDAVEKASRTDPFRLKSRGQA